MNLEIFVWKRQIPRQTTHVAPENFGEGAKVIEGRIPPPPFDAAHIAGIKAGRKREGFL